MVEITTYKKERKNNNLQKKVIHVITKHGMLNINLLISDRLFCRGKLDE